MKKKNCRPVANLPSISNTQIHSHLISNGIVDNFQLAYETGNSCEIALLKVHNNMVTMIGRGNGAMLVLLYLSTAFDTIDHDNLFSNIDIYVGLCACGNALKLCLYMLPLCAILT